MDDLDRCSWAISEPCRTYHDEEWGVPVRDDRLLFEMLTLEGAQAGLSWETVLKKRQGYRDAFANFEVELVSEFTDSDVDRLMADPSIVRNRAKILSTVNNARRIADIQLAGGSFTDLIWAFVDGQPLDTVRKTLGEIPAKTDVSVRMSRSLQSQGFKFVGPTICYAFMQAAGLVDDHTENCFRHKANRSR